MRSRITKEFREGLRLLPSRVREQAHAAHRQWMADFSYPGLQYKKVALDPPVWSVRVGIHHRALATIDGEDIVWFWIGTHAEYDLILRRL